jgi:CRP-like cAMP-binding protein
MADDIQPTGQPRFANRLLSALAPSDLALLEPQLEPLALELRANLQAANEPIEYAYFLEDGLASVVAHAPHDRSIEAGIIGDEGMTGLPIVLGVDRSPNDVYIQVAGRANRLSADALRSAIDASPSLHRLLLRFMQVFQIQTTRTSLANGRASTNQRLARWLLMAYDRLHRNEVPLTHEFLGLMLGVRRAGVTVALQELEGEGLIKASRSLIIIRDRAGLEEIADGYYGVPEAEYRRLFGEGEIRQLSERHQAGPRLVE